MSANVCKDRLGCSYRILIGPLNEKSPEPGYCTAPSEPLTTPPAATHESTTPTKQRHLDASPATSPDRPSQQNSVSQDSYMTASSSFQQPQENTPSALAMSVPSPSPPTSIASSTASTHTVRPLHKSSALQDSFSRRLHKIKQGRSYLQPHFTHTHASAHFHQPLQQPLHLLWRKAGPVFMPRLPAPSDSRQASLSGNNVVLKHDILLCSAIIGMSLQPSAYHSQNHHTRRDPGRQLEAVLTPSSLSCYDSPGWLWPGRKCHYCIPLNDASKPVSLRLLSPLDYSFSVFVGQGKDAMMVMFVARCKSLCLEWYLALYRLLSDHGKCTLPLACDVYVPSLDLQLQIPMVFDKTTRGDNNDEQDPRYYITAEQVKDAVLDLLEEDNLLYRKDMELCWVHGDRAEWVYWQYDLNLQHRSDLIMGPQTIEHTHQLQLRQIQHLPRKVVLKDRVELKEPFPVEGFLHKVSNFKGQVNKPVWKHQKYYFATFQWFLFYTPAHKIQLPDTCTFVPVNQDLPWHPALSSLNQATSPYITLISPFASHPQVCESWQTDELGRRMALIKHAKGCIDLTEVLYVQRSFCDVTDALLTSSAISSEGASSTTPFLASAQPNYQTDQTRRNNHTCFIVLVMKNGLTVKLKAFDSATCEKWVSCLSDLITYYTAQLEAERDVHSNCLELKPANASSMPVPTQPDTTKPNPDTRIWNMCIYDQCQDVVKTGWVYMQQRQGVFSQKLFVLTADGWLHCFNLYDRSPISGAPKRSAVHLKKSSIDLANTYVYSGWVSRTGQHKKTLVNGSRGGHLEDDWDDDNPPRLFSQGLVATDPNHDCSFTLWFPKPRRVFSSRTKRILVYRTDQWFNAKGRLLHFLVPNRKLKEEWVTAINIVQEQLLREAITQTSS